MGVHHQALRPHGYRLWDLPRWTRCHPRRKAGPTSLQPRLELLERRVVLSPTIFTVNSTGSGTSGSGTSGTLPYVISLANANSNTAGSEIVFDPTVFSSPQTITLTAGMLELSGTTGTISIAGPAAGLTVSGGGNILRQIRVFQVDPGVTASISGLTISDGLTFSGNGGGMANYGTATLTDCTVSGNTGKHGGGVFNSGGANLTMTDCTLSGNYAYGSSGGGLYNSGTAKLTLNDCTLSGNYVNGYIDGVGAGMATYGTANLTGTIVAGNGNSDLSGTSDVSGSNNLIGTGAVGLLNGGNGNLVGVSNPGMGSLGNYGGPTETIPLLPGSPALGAGNAVAGVTTDQRGEPLDTPNPDIGAFQSQGFTLSVAAGSTPQTAAISTAFSNPLALSITANNPVEPVDGVVVTFAAPPETSGASALLSASSVVIAGGQVSVSAIPNNMDGSYTVTAATSGASPATFDLTNIGPAFDQLIVNTTSGSLLPGAGLLSLPEAVQFANVDLGNANISFDPTLFSTPQTITLSGSQLELEFTGGTETITGPAAGLTISGGGTSRVFQVDSGVTASIFGVTISDGSVPGAGAGLVNYGTATLTACTLSGNTTPNAGTYPYGLNASGGAVFNSSAADLTLTDCTLSGNSGAADLKGGAVCNTGTASLTGCTLSDNDADEGGGVYNSGSGDLTLTDCTVTGNSSGYNGGGVANYGGTSTLVACTVSGNTSLSFQTTYGIYGGGYPGRYPAIYAWNAGVYNGFGTVNLTDTIVAGNTNPLGASDVGGSTTVSGNNNLVGPGGSGGLTNGVDGNIVLTSLTGLGLAPLGNNGGPTQTRALLPGSPAIDAGSDSIAGITIPATDQRGALRGPAGLNAGPAPDIGAYEASSSYLVTSLADSPDAGTLRAAIGWANISTNSNPANIADPAPNTIVFDTSGAFATPQTITLSGALGTLELSGTATAIAIQGPAVGVTINGDGTVGVFQVESGVTASLSGLTISGGSTTGNGGGLLGAGTVTLTDCTLSGNSAGLGGGVSIAAGGIISLTDCTISGNVSRGGGGLYLGTTSTAILVDCTLDGDSATASGGGIYNDGGTLTLTNVTVSGNTAASGGGLAIAQPEATSGNEIIEERGTTTITNCTVSGNTAAKGGGLYDPAGAPTLGNTIVAGNSATMAGPDAFGTFGSQGYNLVGETDGSTGWVGLDLTGTVAAPFERSAGTLGQ